MSSKCCIGDCNNLAAYGRKGYCGSHYRRQYRHGDPLAGGTPKRELQNFLQEVVLPFSGKDCLIWPYTLNGAGYGQIRRGDKKLLVTRIVCEQIHGKSPTDKHEVAHSCGNGHLGCCNPKHLRWATRSENQNEWHYHKSSNMGRWAAAHDLAT